MSSKSVKYIWNEEDFDVMIWHDVRVHAMAFQPELFELLFDIDYIFEWIKPQKTEEQHFSFYISPATLVFKNVYNFEAFLNDPLGLELTKMSRQNPCKPKNASVIDSQIEWKWILEFIQ